MFSPNQTSAGKGKALLVALIFIALILGGIGAFFRWGGSMGGSEKSPVVGIVSFGGSFQEAVKGLKEGMGTLGYKEGESVVYRDIDAAGSNEKVKEAASGFVRDHVDVIYAVSSNVTQQVSKVAHDVPVVFNVVGDPIGLGVAKTLASSGTNFTGCSVGQYTGKRLEILKSFLPGVHKVLVLYDPTNAYSQQAITVLEKAAPDQGMTIIKKQVKSPDDVVKIMKDTKQGQYDAFFNFGEAKVSTVSKIVADRAKEIKLPTLSTGKNFAEEGTLITYGASWLELGRQCASVMDKILHGVKPADIPIQSPAKVELTVNMKTAALLGITFPKDQLIRVDTFIE